MGSSRRVRQIAVVLGLACLAAPLGCAQRNNGEPGGRMIKPEIIRMLHMAVRSNLPPFAEDIDGHAYTVQDSVYLMRFVCSKRSLEEFLYVSPVLPNQLDANVNQIDDSLARPEWWRPNEMQQVAGAHVRRTDGPLEFDCQLVAGNAGRKGFQTVYVRLTVVRGDVRREAERETYEKSGHPIPPELLSEAELSRR